MLTLVPPVVHGNLGLDLQTNILRQSYNNAKVTIDLQRTHNLQKHPRKGARYDSLAKL